MIDCPRTDVRDLLPDWVNGSLGEPASTDVAEHVTTCAACADEAELLRSVRGILVREPDIDVGRVAAAVTARTLGRGEERARRRWWRPVLGGLAVAASALFGALLLQRDAEPEAGAPVAQTDSSRATQPVAAMPDDPRPDPARIPDDSATPERGASPEPELRLAGVELAVGGALADLGDDQLEALLRRLDSMEALPQTSPAPALITDFEVR
jgi:hypothetical protein